MSLRWGNVNFDERTLHIKDTKNKSSRHAHMTSEVEAMLLQRYEKRGSGRNEKLFKADGLSKTFERVVENLGLNEGVNDSRERVVFHTLRHTFASWHAKAGTPLFTISKLLGHKTIAMTERYSHLCPDAERQAAMALQGVMSEPKAAKSIPFAKTASTEA